MSPLNGLQVIDFGQGVAGPYCGQLLGDLGADVIKIEPPRGDWSRTMGTAGGVYLSVNRNKRGVCLDLRDAETQSIVRTAAERADVIIESFRPGVMGKLGLDYSTLRAINPKLIYCSVTGFGPSGPNSNLPAGDSIMQAYGGLMSIIGERDGPPLRVGNVVSDMLAGMNAFSGILLALIDRAVSNRGRHVQISLLDSIVAFQAPPLTEFLLTGAPPDRAGNDHPLIAPSGAMATRDGRITFTVFDHQWPDFCDELGIPDEKDNPLYCTSEARQQNRSSLKAVLEPLFQTRTTGEWIAELRRMDILCAPVNNYSDLINDPQVTHNRLFGTLPTRQGTQIPNVACPIAAEDWILSAQAAPMLGEHTAEVLTALWGVSPEVLGVLTDRRAAFVHKTDAVRAKPGDKGDSVVTKQ